MPDRDLTMFNSQCSILIRTERTTRNPTSTSAENCALGIEHWSDPDRAFCQVIFAQALSICGARLTCATRRPVTSQPPKSIRVLRAQQYPPTETELIATIRLGRVPTPAMPTASRRPKGCTRLRTSPLRQISQL